MYKSLTFCTLLFITILPLSGQEIDILDKEGAAHRIVQDSMDGYFEKVRPLEVSIQMKDASLSSLQPGEAIKILKNGLRNEVVDPDDDQRSILEESLKEALQLSKPFTKDYPLPDTVWVGILKGNVYGPNTFFTRQNGIFVPTGLVKRAFQSQLTKILIHELFHIQSRYHPEIQEHLYQEIGFLPLQQVPEMDSAFRNRILVNPDGTDWQYYIPLSKSGDTVRAYPMIVANESTYMPQKPQFFAYLQFQLFPLQETDDGYRVEYGEGFTGLDGDWMPVFFDGIKDNTQYIIHPDEIMADNFVLLTLAKADRLDKQLSEEGQQLLKDLADVYGVELE